MTKIAKVQRQLT